MPKDLKLALRGEPNPIARICVEHTDTGPRIYVWSRIEMEPRSVARAILGMREAWMRTTRYSSLAEALRDHPHASIQIGTPVPTDRAVVEALEGGS